MQGPEGRPPNVSPAREGWEIDPEEDPSAVGAALYRSSALPVSLGAYPDPQFCGPFLEMFSTGRSAMQRPAVSTIAWKRSPSLSNKFVISTGAQRSGEICGSFFGANADTKPLIRAI